MRHIFSLECFIDILIRKILELLEVTNRILEDLVLGNFSCNFVT